ENSKLNEVDLSPLSSCLNLKNLQLSMNELITLDLSPLAACTNLESLSLYNYQLREVDLSPLAHCKKFSDLRIEDSVTLLWVDDSLPRKFRLPRALRKVYNRLTVRPPTS
ncbi:MAG: hypothetical protein ACFE9L_21790, partial [Candidatus Hodarchaeota archaeon]